MYILCVYIYIHIILCIYICIILQIYIYIYIIVYIYIYTYYMVHIYIYIYTHYSIYICILYYIIYIVSTFLLVTVLFLFLIILCQVLGAWLLSQGWSLAAVISPHEPPQNIWESAESLEKQPLSERSNRFFTLAEPSAGSDFPKEVNFLRRWSNGPCLDQPAAHGRVGFLWFHWDGNHQSIFRN